MTVRIALADDHLIVRMGLRALLEARSDFEVCGEAGDGREAIELVHRHQPDVMVIDTSLPLVNGIEATRHIRKGCPKTEILLFTRHNSEGLVEEGFRAGARGYILKSEDGEQIINAVDALARHQAFFSTQISEALLENIRSGRGFRFNVLTSRERQIVQLIAEGRTNKEIARQLNVSPKTIECHRSAIMRKLNSHSIAELVRYAIRNNLVEA